MNEVVEKLKGVKKTEATRFILPMLSDKFKKDVFFVNKYFLNCYIGDSNKPEYEGKILLHYRYEPSVNYIKFEKQLELIPQHIGDYDYDDIGSVMHVFDVPERWQSEYKHFLEGRYSKFSNEYKALILRFWWLGVDNILFSLLYRTDKIKKYWEKKEKNPKDFSAESEYWHRPNMDIEIYTVNKVE